MECKDTQSIFWVNSIDSTNNLLLKKSKTKDLPQGYVVAADFQTSGKGQYGNKWESEAGQNLLFSVLLYPEHIPIAEQFSLSQIAGLAVKNVLDCYVDNISVKWPNDVFWKDKKICGILIENSLVYGKISRSIIGVGLNVNQKEFVSGAPNPVSLSQILGKQIDRVLLLQKIIDELMRLYNDIDFQDIHTAYLQSLYRKDGLFTYVDSDSGNRFQASIEDVQPDGKLILLTSSGQLKSYYFKEVQFVL